MIELPLLSLRSRRDNLPDCNPLVSDKKHWEDGM